MTLHLDYSSIAEHLSHFPIVGIGESTHGTHEFFEAKVELFKILITSYGFDTIFFEAMDDNCSDINKYIQTGVGNPKDLVNNLYYVYRTNEVLDLVQWLQIKNKIHAVSFIGLDERRRLKSYLPYNIQKANLRDKNMASVIKSYIEKNPDAKALIWAHDRHISAHKEHLEKNPEIYYKPMGWNLRERYVKRYFALSQLFGEGYFNAALIDESDKSDNKLVVEHFAPLPPNNFWEARLSNELTEPTFLEESDLIGLAKKDEKLYQRELGSHVKKSEIHSGNNIARVDISEAYNAVIFFPHTTSSNLLSI